MVLCREVQYVRLQQLDYLNNWLALHTPYPEELLDPSRIGPLSSFGTPFDPSGRVCKRNQDCHVLI
jgi:hypothetical protein